VCSSDLGTAGLVLDMADSGGLLGRPALAISVRGPGGYHRTVTDPLDTMLPDNRITYSLPWADALAAGDYTVDVTATVDGHAVGSYSTMAQLGSDLAATGPPGSVKTPASSGSAVPAVPLVAAIAAVAALGLGVAVGGTVTRRRRLIACAHCHTRGPRRDRLEVTLLEEMSGCRPCARLVHNDGRALLCPSCYRRHALVSLAGSPFPVALPIASLPRAA